ncbi:phage tail length tape measure family protein [Rhodoferax aquaticus]|uniref:Bacteriophage tail tape measure N-terminal domain-containing protein n=1 Tax=Rhodoferax aquaticus TaxID=2527691 RepID=A0A515ERM7_9BURK|nr:phage tail length tape measure family protein [Rhodoferax aquaticus]QDL55300.1 hypothetical protein EXZ61_14615 [Rhodoferax aquaticus]
MTVGIGIKLGLDTSEVEAGLERTERGIDGIGTRASKTTEGLNRAERSAVSSLQRVQAALETSSKSEYTEKLFDLRGIDKSKPQIAALLAGLKEVEAAQAALKASSEAATLGNSKLPPVLDKTGISAAQTANAMRMIPAQMTDVVVSLQSGQAPLTVLLQQGGQLKDMFGGVGPAIASVGTYLRSLVSPLTLAAAGIGTVAIAMYEGSQEADAYSQAIALSGNASGVTLSQLQAMAKGIDAVRGTQGEAAETLAQFVQAGLAGGASLERFSLAAMDWERTTGTAVKSTVSAFVELAKEPLVASLKFNDSLHYLTASMYEQIKALVEQGRMTEAANLAQNTFADTLQSRSAEMVENTGLLVRGWAGVKKIISETGDALKNLGRSDTLQEQIDSLNKSIDDKRTYLGREQPNSGFSRVLQDEIRVLEAQKRPLQEKLEAQEKIASSRARESTLLSALVKWDKDGAQFLSRKAQMEQAIQRTRKEGLAAGKDEETIERRIADIREKYADKKAPKAAAHVDTTYVKLLDDLALADEAAQQYLATGETISSAEKFRLETLKRINDEWLRGKLTLDQAVDAESLMNEAYAKQVDVLQAISDEKQFASDREENAKNLEATQKQTESLQDQLSKEQEHVQQLGLSKTALAELVVQKLEDQAIGKDRLADLFMEIDATGQMSAQYREQAQALRDLAEAKRGSAAKEVAIDTQKDAEKLSKQTADTLRNDLKGAFSAAFRDSSGDPLKAFGDALENMIFTRAATALSESVMNAADSFMGQAGGGGGGFGDFLSNILSFDGGGYTGSNARTGGLDGKGGFMAMLHPQETVTDHSKGQQVSTGGAISVVQHINVDSRSDQATIMAAMQQAKAETMAAIQQSRRAGGVFA